MSRRGVVLTALLIAGFPMVSGAHAFLDHAEPPVGASLTRAPARAMLRFSEQIEPEFSTIRVMDANGRQRDRGDVHGVDGAPQALEVPLPLLPPGEYTVVWQVRTTDQHTTHGDYHFTVTP